MIIHYNFVVLDRDAAIFDGIDNNKLIGVTDSMQCRLKKQILKHST